MQLSAEIDPQKTYRLLQLTPQLEASLREGTLDLKGGSDGSVFACTSNSTHLVRILKQTNTLLVSQAHDEHLSAFASPTSFLETNVVPGTIDWSQVPEYGKTAALPEPEICCSQAEFEEQCRTKPAALVDGRLYSIPTSVVHNVLVHLVSSMVEAGDTDLQMPLESLNIETGDPPEIIRAVYNKFYVESRLDLDQISKFTGIYLLSQAPQGMPKAEFVREWRLDLPVKLNTDIASLYGHIVEHDTTLKLLDHASLPTDPKLRFHKLFSIKPDWPLAEISPFIRDLVPSTQKLDAWVLKYACKKRVHTDIYLTPLRR